MNPQVNTDKLCGYVNFDEKENITGCNYQGDHPFAYCFDAIRANQCPFYRPNTNDALARQMQLMAGYLDRMTQE